MSVMQFENSSYEMLCPILNKIMGGNKEKKACFLLTHVPNPRINKRIEVFKNNLNTTVICTRRSSQNIWEPTQDVEHIIFNIDLPTAKHMVKRCYKSRDFQKRAQVKLEEIKPDVIYAEGLDSLIIAGKYKKNKNVKIFFEVADLRENYIVKPRKFLEKIITGILLRKEKKIFKNVDYLIVTSPKFYDIHYKELIPKERILFIPNTPGVNVFKNYKKKKNGIFTVGFIGGIRYLKQMKMLVDVANELGCNVLFAGAGITSCEYDEIRAYCKGMQNIIFTGKYNFNTEIAGLYSKIDCVYSVYDADNPNVRIALPNKLYESIECELPIVVAKGTYLAELVEKYGVGVSVSHKDKSELASVLRHMKDSIKYRESFAEKCREYKRNNVDKGSESALISVATKGNEL